MADWRSVKADIEDELDRIWWEEPAEVRMCRERCFPSGAGTAGQTLGNLLFLVADTQAMGWWTAEPAMKQALADETFSLEQCKRMWRYMTGHMALLVGSVDPPLCPAPWLNLPKVTGFYRRIIDTLDSVQTKDEFADLLWSWFNYVNRMNKWFFLIFPWHLEEQRQEPSCSSRSQPGKGAIV